MNTILKLVASMIAQHALVLLHTYPVSEPAMFGILDDIMEINKINM